MSFTIALQNNDGTVSVILCGGRGGLETAGKILFNHYYTYLNVQVLIDMGNLVNLGPSYGTKHDGVDPRYVWAHVRDLEGKEEDHKARVYSEADSVCGIHDFNYLFSGGLWYFSTIGDTFFKPLTLDLIVKKDIDADALRRVKEIQRYEKCSRLRAWRKYKQMSLVSCAKHIGISHAKLAGFETHTKMPSPEDIRNIERFYRRDEAVLFDFVLVKNKA